MIAITVPQPHHAIFPVAIPRDSLDSTRYLISHIQSITNSQILLFAPAKYLPNLNTSHRLLLMVLAQATITPGVLQTASCLLSLVILLALCLLSSTEQPSDSSNHIPKMEITYNWSAQNLPVASHPWKIKPKLLVTASKAQYGFCLAL